MSVISSRLVRGVQGASFGLKNEHSVSLRYEIQTDSNVMLPYTVVLEATRGLSSLSGPGTTNDLLPQRYDKYDFSSSNTYGNRNFGADEKNLSIFATQITVEQNKDKLTQWFANVTWGALPPRSQPSDATANPTARTPVYWFEFGNESVESTQAYNVNTISSTPFTRVADTWGPIVNAAGQDYDTAIYRDRKIVTLVIQKNFNTDLWAVQLNNTYDETLNDAPMFKGEDWEVAKHCAKFDGATSSKPIFDNDSTYYEIQIRIRLARKPFYHDIVNRGYKYFDGAGISAKLVKAVDEEGNDVSEPALLTADGRKLGSDTLGNTIKYRDLEDVSYAPLEAYLS